MAITCQTSRTQVLVETGSFFNGLISLEPLQNNERKKDEVKFGSEQVVLEIHIFDSQSTIFEPFDLTRT